MPTKNPKSYKTVRKSFAPKYKSSNLNKRVTALEKQIEYKRTSDWRSLPITSTTTGVRVNDFALTVQAVTEEGRIGNEVTLKQVKFNYEINCIAAGQPNRVRLILVQYMQSVGAALTLADVLEDSSVPFLSPWKKNADVRYRILFDKTHKCGQQLTTQSLYSLFGKAVIKMNINQHYAADADTLPDKNMVCLYAVKELAYGANPPTIQGYFSAVFTDS